jgi:hypothetical protein
LKRLLQVGVGIFALIGLGYTALALYMSVAMPKCMLLGSSEAQSQDGKYFAVFEQTRCEDSSRSRASVSMGRVGNPADKIVRMNVKGTTDVRLTWNGSRELVVVLPPSAIVEPFGPYDGWPPVVEQH